MKAVYIEGFTGADGLTVRDVEKPSAGAEHVLVRVHAAGLNRADLLQAAGKYPPPAGYSPNIPGLEFAGEIAELGADVDGWNVGDRVFGITAGEAQAEFAVVPADQSMRIPDDLDFVEAAAMPEVFITAHDAIFSRCRLKAGETLLIHAVGSGVGLAALQMAKAVGATVIGTSRTADKLERCVEFGLDDGILTSKPVQFAAEIERLTGSKGVDVFLDLVGAAYFEENLLSLGLKGRLIIVGLTSGTQSSIDLSVILRKRAEIHGTFLRARSVEEKGLATQLFFADLEKMRADNAVVPNVDKVFAVEDVRDAYEYLASNESFGKVVLTF